MSRARTIPDPLSVTGTEQPIASVLRHLAGQENCDGEPYDQMIEAADYIDELEAGDTCYYDDHDWPDCPEPGCANKICLSLSSDKCYPHTRGWWWWKTLRIFLRVRGRQALRGRLGDVLAFVAGMLIGYVVHTL